MSLTVGCQFPAVFDAVCSDVWTPVPVRHNTGYFCQHTNTQRESHTHFSALPKQQLPLVINSYPSLYFGNTDKDTYIYTAFVFCTVFSTYDIPLTCPVTSQSGDCCLPLYEHKNTNSYTNGLYKHLQPHREASAHTSVFTQQLFFSPCCASSTQFVLSYSLSFLWNIFLSSSLSKLPHSVHLFDSSITQQSIISDSSCSLYLLLLTLAHSTTHSCS